MLHPDADRKIGCGIESFFVAETGYGTLGFHIKRVDGSWDNLSYRKCISAPSHKSRVLGAMRCAARPWLTSYGDELWKTRNVDGLIPCAETGEFLPRSELKLDHRAPRTFEAIAHAFLTVICKFPADAPWDHVELRPPEDQDYEHLLADDKLSRFFAAKHSEWSNGHLEFVERHINMSLKSGLR
jgi:hypothetical protein